MHNGISTRFWTDRWAGPFLLQEIAKHQISVSLSSRVVADYWEVGVGWRWNELSPWLTYESLLQLAALGVRSDPSMDDLIAWMQPITRFSLLSQPMILELDGHAMLPLVFGRSYGVSKSKSV